ncbi:ABC transporter ATP-binding protein [Desulfosarcina ovata]|uniref:Nickel import system ATP-binding protein NikD n=2 Tax=Desulfosarcina ovata TaxID=83564 RepID=A0A5K8AAP5_9BACT|nr:ABC transporter ATP-binding protein [Desulfosarcina ovata]BBO82394.1 peptide ABC transporter ATP-binding protein [Desulfosarcina ovata subsp. sediminis]BBO89586.1 peptide ABC transporter ATP-binding protein [Desulfosarcina ovata subsp. ovata]
MLSLHDITLSFTRYETGLIRKELPVLNGLDLVVKKNELVGVVGASGSGKSLLAHAVLGILPANANLTGTMEFKGAPLTHKRQQAVRGKEIALIPQSITFLDPLQRIGEQVRRAAILSGVDKKTAILRQKAAFERYQLPPSTARLFPFQLSGGMVRRALLATATVGNADLLIADEPTPGLQPQIVSESLSHFRELADSGKGVLLITHELDAVLHVADKIAVFYGGTILEEASANDFDHGGKNLRHPFTRALWEALPGNAFKTSFFSREGPGSLVQGCPLYQYCAAKTDLCAIQPPIGRRLNGGFVRCHNA